MVIRNRVLVLFVGTIFMLFLKKFHKYKNYILFFLLFFSYTYDFIGQRNMTNLVYYVHYFISGVFVALNTQYIARIFDRFNQSLAFKFTCEFIFVGLLVILFTVDMRSGHFINNVISTILLIVLLSLSINVRVLLLPNWMAKFGLVTYYIYLLHPIFIKLFSVVVTSLNLSFTLLSYIFVLILLIFLLSSLYFLFFEKIIVFVENKYGASKK
jgi:peptidoglycan/LPS O-acetylase OafA/YrhL